MSEQNYCYQCCLYDICKHIDRGTHTLASPACDAFDPGMRWIPVTERLPEVGEEFVLVFVNGRYHNIKFAGAAEIAMYDEDGWWIEAYPEWKNPRVTHWMPLPDAPKEDEKEE